MHRLATTQNVTDGRQTNGRQVVAYHKKHDRYFLWSAKQFNLQN